eukprot:tig00020553_g10679.t1
MDSRFLSNRPLVLAWLVGLSVSSALGLSANLNWAVRQFTELEVQMNAVERILQYRSIEPEAPLDVPGAGPAAGWPPAGRVEFKDVTLRYRPAAPPVLQGVTAAIRPGEKVGIVGRTGAGKSTLTIALFRVVELAAGRIEIDGVDIAGIGLRPLREAIAIIPQAPAPPLPALPSWLLARLLAG